MVTARSSTVLGVEVDLASVVVDQRFEQVGERPFGAVVPVDKRRQNGNGQIRMPGKKLHHRALPSASNYPVIRMGS